MHSLTNCFVPYLIIIVRVQETTATSATRTAHRIYPVFFSEEQHEGSAIGTLRLSATVFFTLILCIKLWGTRTSRSLSLGTARFDGSMLSESSARN